MTFSCKMFNKLQKQMQKKVIAMEVEDACGIPFNDNVDSFRRRTNYY